MKFVEPKVFHVARTGVIDDGVQAYLSELEIPDWVTDAPSDAELITEIFGRGCYRSYQVGMNKNVTRIREGNKSYVSNILSTRHGSVVEHGSDSYIFFNVSRVLTHELVRNRIGNSFSQESLRYVRLDSLKAWFPKVFEDHPRRDELRAFMQAAFERKEDEQRELAQLLSIDSVSDFATKKKLTSAMRRFAPIGLATMIAYTGNHRSIRWAIEQRTDPVAEEEIRLVFGEVAREQARCYPNLYQDMAETIEDGIARYSFANSKI